MKKLLVWAVILAAGFYFGAKFYLHYQVSKSVDNVLLMLSPFAQVTYSGVSSTMSGTLSIDDVVVQVNGYRSPLQADKLSLVTPGFWHLLDLNDVRANLVASDIPESMAFAVVGFQSDVDSDLMRYMHKLGQEGREQADVSDAAACTGRFGFSPQDLQRLGYSTLGADLSVGYRKDGGRTVLDIETSLVDMYDLTVELTLDGVLSPRSMASGSYRPKLIDGRLEYIDQSLDQRTTSLCERAGLSAQEVLAAKLETFLSVGADNGIVFDEQIVEPYKEFLGGKSTFVITAAPHEPVTMSQIGLYKPADVPALLNLSASAH